MQVIELPRLTRSSSVVKNTYRPGVFVVACFFTKSDQILIDVCAMF